MVSKQETLKILKYAAEYEESIILGWRDSFISGILADPDISEEKKEKMIGIIKTIGVQSMQHFRTFNDWRLRVSRSDNNEY